MDSVCDICKAKKVWQGSMASGRMECPNGCAANLKDLDDGPDYRCGDDDEELTITPQGKVVPSNSVPLGGVARNIDMLNVSTSVKTMLTSLWNMMQPWQTNGLPIGLWRVTKDPRVCCQGLCIHCLRAYDWLGPINQFRIENSECPQCYVGSQNMKQAARPIQPPPQPVPPPAPGTLMKRGIRYDQNRMAFVALCRGCGTEFIVNDVAMYDPDMSYCGRTPRCQP